MSEGPICKRCSELDFVDLLFLRGVCERSMKIHPSPSCLIRGFKCLGLISVVDGDDNICVADRINFPRKLFGCGE